MPTENENVQYSFQGDVSSLRQAAEQAIDLLGKYESAVKSAATKDTFTASKTSFTGFQRSINGIIGSVNTLTKALNASGDAVASGLPNGAGVVGEAVRDLTDTLDYLNSSTTITSQDMQFLQGYLAETRNKLADVANRAAVLGASFREIGALNAATPLQNEAAAADQASAATTRLAEATQQSDAQARAAAKSVRDAQSAWTESGKSARASAEVFVQASVATASLVRATQQSDARARAAAKSVRDAQSAWSESGKSALTSAEAFVQASRNATKMGGFKDKLKQMQAELSILGGKAHQAFSKVAEAFAPITQKIQSFKDKASKAFEVFKTRANDVLKSVRRASKESDDSGGKSSFFGKLAGTLSNVTYSFSGLTSDISRNNGAFKLLGNSVGLVKKAFAALSGVAVGDWFTQCTNAAIDYVETMNLFEVAMGKSTAAASEFINKMSEVYGMDPKSLMDAAGTMYLLTDAIHMPEEASTSMALSLTKAANDVASLYNVSVESVVNNFESGLMGITRSVKKYGFDITEATLQQTAFSYGLTESVNSMSEANKRALRYLSLMAQMKKSTSQLTTDINGNTVAMGDFARTIESPANQLRIFQEQIAQLGRAIGNYLTTPLAKVIAYINGFVMALRMALNFIGSLIGVMKVFEESTVATEGASESIDGITESAKDAEKAVKKLTTPFDELNILQENSSKNGSGIQLEDTLDPALLKAIQDMELSIDNVQMKANKIRDTILGFFGFKTEGGNILGWDADAFEANLIAKFPQWTQTIQAAFDNWAEIVDGFKAVWHSLGSVVDAIKSKISDVFGKYFKDESVASFIDTLGEKLQNLATWIEDHSETIANLAIVIGVVALAFNPLVKIVSKVAKLAKVIGTVVKAISSLGAAAGWIALIVAAIGLLCATSDEFAASFKNMLGAFVRGIGQILSDAWDFVKEIWEGLLKPLLSSIGDALAPVLDVITNLWKVFVTIIGDLFDFLSSLLTGSLVPLLQSVVGTIDKLIGNVANILKDAVGLLSEKWESVVKPVLDAVSEAVNKVFEIIDQLWNECIGPVLEYIGDGLEDLWNSCIKDVVGDVIDIVGKLLELIMALWNNVLAPIISWLVDAFGPTFKGVFKAIWDVVAPIIESITKLIGGILQALEGVIDFLTGVFAGDWERAWKGLVNILVGIGNALIGVVETIINALIGVLNLLWSDIVEGVKSVVNIILGGIEDIASWVGIDLNVRWTGDIPRIPPLRIPRIPTLATGGVIQSPTMALVGEGRYDEAVLPLEDSPQMEHLVQRIADAVDKQTPEDKDDKPIIVKVYIDGQEVTSSQNRRNRMFGKTLQEV